MKITMRVKQYCCEFSLRTGTMILLWLSVFFQISLIYELVGDLSLLMRLFRYNLFLWISLLMVSFFGLVATLLALLGVAERQPSYLLSYIVVPAAKIIYYSLIILLDVRDLIPLFRCKSSYSGNAESECQAPLFPWICALVIFIAVEVYLMIIVHSYYKQLLEEASGLPTSRAEYAAPSHQQSGAKTRNNGVKTRNNYARAFETYIIPCPQLSLTYPPRLSDQAQKNLVQPQQ